MILVILWGTWVQYQPHTQDEIVAGEYVTEVTKLSDYYPGLLDTSGDTDVYVLEGEEEGGTILVLGGTHANEISGILASITMIESGAIEKGKIIIIPQTNASGISNITPMRGDPWRVVIENEENQKRSFRYGSRHTHPLDQWPDPVEYEHVSQEYSASGTNARNLNRVHPGKEGGTLTERISYGIIQIIEQEDVNLVFDLHEAGPESNIANFIIAHPDSLHITSDVSLDLEMDGYSFNIDQSNLDFRGLSHREFGELTPAHAILSETANPYQGSYFVDTSMSTILSGEDEGYEEMMQREKMNPNYEDLSLRRRVASQLKIVSTSISTLSIYNPENELIFEFPDPEIINNEGLAEFLSFNN